MSAYIVSKNHVLFLVAAAMSNRISRHGFSWYHNQQSSRIGCGDYEKAADVANMLWMENIASVSGRYPNESSNTLPGKREDSYVITIDDVARAHFDRIDPVQVLKSCDCFEYQSCEHDGWEASEAHTIIECLRSAAWHSLPGYESAEWGAPEIREGVISLSALLPRRR